MTDPTVYVPRRPFDSRYLEVRGLSLHAWCWEPEGAAQYTLIAAHGWMDLGASFQFLVDHLPVNWRIIAPDWRGFGRSDRTPGDSYWFYDYLGDLDSILDQLLPDEPVNLLGHSMGGNLVMLYAGIRPGRIRRLINLEGTGMPPMDPDRAPGRIAKWLDQLKDTRRLRPYAGTDEVAARLMKNNPRLRADRAAWLATYWSAPTDDGQYRLLADPAHKHINPYLYRVAETDACWAQIQAPVLWVDSQFPNDWHAFTKAPQYQERLARIRQLSRHVLADCGHMLHHDQPEALAALVQDFVSGDD